MARQRIVAGFIATLLLAVSITAMASTILEAQRAKTADEGDTRSKYDRAQSAYDNANIELKTLVAANVRAVGQVKADIDAVKASGKALEYTSNCTDFERDLAQFRRSCQPLLQLRSQMADAQRKAELEAKVRGLKSEADALKPTEQAAVAEASVSEAWGWIMGFAVVFVATFGPVIFARAEPSEVSATAAEELPNRSVTGAPDTPSVTPEAPATGPQNGNGEPKGPNRPKGGGTAESRLQRHPKPGAPSKGPNRHLTLGEIRTDLMVRNATGRAFGSQKEAADHYGYSESRYSELSKSWETEGFIPKRRMVGRSKQLTPAE